MSAPLDRVRVGFIGAGRISDLHALEYRTNPNAEIVAIADVNVGQAAERARAWGFPEAKIYSDFRALLDDPRVDAVEILLPHHLHAAAAIAALDAGKHVSLQKPMTDRMLEAKFTQLAEPVLGAAKVQDLLAACWNLGKAGDVRALAALARP